jgi:hypothetical protein
MGYCQYEVMFYLQLIGFVATDYFGDITAQIASDERFFHILRTCAAGVTAKSRFWRKILPPLLAGKSRSS